VQRVAVGTGCASEAEIDAAWMQGGQRPELLGDHKRRMVGQHDPAGAEPDVLGVRGDMRDQHARGRGCDRRHVVMLGVPDPLITGVLCQPGERHARCKALARGLAVPDGRKIENGQR
jgi:hypothetical protein